MRKTEQQIGKQFYFISAPEALWGLEMPLRPPQSCQFTATNLSMPSWKPHYLSWAFPSLSGNSTVHGKPEALKNRVQPQDRLQVHREMKSKTNQVHLSHLTKASITLAQLVRRAIDHVPRVPSWRYVPSKPYKQKANRILVTDYKAIWSMNSTGLAIAYTCLKTFRVRWGQGFKRKKLQFLNSPAINRIRTVAPFSCITPHSVQHLTWS